MLGPLAEVAVLDVEITPLGVAEIPRAGRACGVALRGLFGAGQVFASQQLLTLRFLQLEPKAAPLGAPSGCGSGRDGIARAGTAFAFLPLFAM